MEKQNEKKEILLNIMYTGTYLEGTNIGHEIINFFKDDNGNNYIYVLHDGSMSKIHNDKIDTILLVRRCTSNTMEILAKATGLTQIARIKKSFRNKEKEEQHNLQIAYINEHNITYGGMKPYEIFKNNVWDTKTEQNFEIYITFKAADVRKVVKPVYISTDKNIEKNENIFHLENIKLKSQSLKIYIPGGTDSYDELNQIINNKTLWEDRNTTRKVDNQFFNDMKSEQNKNNFVEIIKKSYDELTYSNLFKYIFEANAPAFHKFAKEVLGVKNLSGDLSVEREKKNIDLLITDDENAIVIENKIKSGVNGICHDDDRNIKSQLDKYKKYVEDNYQNKNKHYYIFVPNYNHADIYKHDIDKAYKKISYKEIYDFFEQNQALYKDVKYFQEFIFALKKHITPTDNNHEENMYARFCKAINEAKNKKQ